jgi:hypothetical protein
MDHEIEAGVEAVLKSVRERRAASARTKVPVLRDLDERVCLTSRGLYMRFLTTAVWSRSVDRSTLDAVKQALEKALGCLPEHDYAPGPEKEYPVWRSVLGRLEEFRKLSNQLVPDKDRGGWFSIPVPDPEGVLVGG